MCLMAEDLHISKHITCCSGQLQGNRDSRNPANELQNIYKYNIHCYTNSIFETNI